MLCDASHQNEGSISQRHNAAAVLGCILLTRSTAPLVFPFRRSKAPAASLTARASTRSGFSRLVYLMVLVVKIFRSSVCSDEGRPFQQQVQGGRLPLLACLGLDATIIEVVGNTLQGAAARSRSLNLSDHSSLLLDLHQLALDGFKAIRCLVAILLAGGLFVLKCVGGALGHQVALKLSQD